MDVACDSGELITAHIPNTGSMLGLLTKDSPVMMTKSSDPKRKTAYTVQGIKVGDIWVGVNTHLPNKLIKASLTHPLLEDFAAYQICDSEVRYGVEGNSRVDFRFSQASNGVPDAYLEIKNVTLKVGEQAQFPDTVSVRAHKHVLDLVHVMSLGLQASLIFVVQRLDCQVFSPATAIDKRYTDLLISAHAQGLSVRALCAKLDEKGLCLSHEIPLIL